MTGQISMIRITGLVLPIDYTPEVLREAVLQRLGIADSDVVAEERAFEYGGGDYCAPAQLLGDFLANRPSEALGEVLPSYRPGVRLCNLADILPAYATTAMREALPHFARQIRDFDRDDAVLTGVETRTSSPIRLRRDPESLQSLNVQGLYPGGEGAGYAGGILSAAVDGIKLAEAVARDLCGSKT